MSNPMTRRRRAAVVLTMAAAVVFGTVACSSTDDVTDPTTTVQAGGTTETTEEPTETSRPPRTTIEEDEPDSPGTTRKSDSDDDDEPDVVPTGDETVQDYADALISSYNASSDEIFSLEVVECVSPLWVEAIGVETFQDAGVAPEDIANGSSDLEDVTLYQATAEAIVDSLPECGLPLFDLFIDGLGSRVKDDPAKVACIQGALTEAQIRAILVDQIRGEEGDDPEDLVGQCLV